MWHHTPGNTVIIAHSRTQPCQQNFTHSKALFFLHKDQLCNNWYDETPGVVPLSFEQWRGESLDHQIQRNFPYWKMNQDRNVTKQKNKQGEKMTFFKFDHYFHAVSEIVIFETVVHIVKGATVCTRDGKQLKLSCLAKVADKFDCPLSSRTKWCQMPILSNASNLPRQVRRVILACSVEKRFRIERQLYSIAWTLIL